MLGGLDRNRGKSAQLAERQAVQNPELASTKQPAIRAGWTRASPEGFKALPPPDRNCDSRKRPHRAVAIKASA